MHILFFWSETPTKLIERPANLSSQYCCMNDFFAALFFSTSNNFAIVDFRKDILFEEKLFLVHRNRLRILAHHLQEIYQLSSLFFARKLGICEKRTQYDGGWYRQTRRANRCCIAGTIWPALYMRLDWLRMCVYSDDWRYPGVYISSAFHCFPPIITLISSMVATFRGKIAFCERFSFDKKATLTALIWVISVLFMCDKYWTVRVSMLGTKNSAFSQEVAFRCESEALGLLFVHWWRTGLRMMHNQLSRIIYDDLSWLQIHNVYSYVSAGTDMIETVETSPLAAFHVTTGENAWISR